ncbi:hypothetical protein Nepgr_012641 [Nepenthes gracilis]|uniref:Uncharacterized protein n=1 Tax=Nepenthes gracilis TaxID=150966 RepID=A0AAD3XNJ0_NEPGR|nr:hypothetical protein Nepgr_012641 [Nepenthes gracilis]
MGTRESRIFIRCSPSLVALLLNGYELPTTAPEKKVPVRPAIEGVPSIPPGEKAQGLSECLPWHFSHLGSETPGCS